MLILALCISWFISVFRFKFTDGILSMEAFYDLPENTVDVITLGSSHAFENINADLLYSEYGVTAFVLAGSIQPLWNTYYYLKESLKTQKPKLVLLDAYCATFYGEFIDESRIIKNTYGMKWSSDYIDAMKVSAPKDQFNDYLFRFTRYHNRYSALTEEDFLPNLGNTVYINWTGHANNFATSILKKPEAYGDETKELYLKTEEWYRKIIQLCKDNDVPIEIIASPYVINQNEYNMLNEAARIARDDYGVNFTNFNTINKEIDMYSEVGIDFKRDFADGAHLNHRGNIKYTRYLADNILCKYNLPDHRGEKKYEYWANHAKWYERAFKSQTIKETNNVAEYFNILKDGFGYTVVIATRGDFTLSSMRNIQNEPGTY